jgi:hypothetical protein
MEEKMATPEVHQRGGDEEMSTPFQLKKQLQRYNMKIRTCEAL